MDFSTLTNNIQPLLDWGGIPLNMASLIALAVGVGWASGLRLYALIFVLGMLGKFAGVILPGDLSVLTHPAVIGISGVMLFVEFFADKIPWVDSVWDSIHTFIRIPAGAALAAAVMGEQGAATQLVFALIGGSITAGTHLAKTSTRAAINTSPEPLTNIISSFGEEVVFAGGLYTLLSNPLVFVIALVIFMAITIIVIVLMWKFLKTLINKLRSKKNYNDINETNLQERELTG